MIKNMTTKKKKTLSFIIFFSISIVIGYFIGMLIGESSLVVSKTTLIIVLLSLIPSFFIVIAIHEAGHAYAGIKVNFDFRMYVIGPFLWAKEQNRWLFKWNKNVNTAGGLVICLPIDTYNLNKRFATYAAGGPLASLLLAVLSFLFFVIIKNLNTQNHLGLEITSSLFLLIAVFSFFILLATAIPFHTGGFSSDGARVLRILNGGEAARFELLILKMISLSTSGTRPKEIDINELTEALDIAKKLKLPQGVYLHGMLHQAEFDLGNIENAEIHLKNYLADIDEIPAGMHNIVYLDAVFFYAFAKEDLIVAENYWQKFKPNAFVTKAQIAASEACLLILRHDFTEVEAKIKTCLSEIPNMLDQGNGKALKEKMVLLQQQLEVKN
jgi:hypothetical protein